MPVILSGFAGATIASGLYFLRHRNDFYGSSDVRAHAYACCGIIAAGALILGGIAGNMIFS